MNIEINIDRQPVAARGVAVRQITYKEMWLKVRETADKLFVAMQQATLDKESAIEALRSADQNITETQQALWAAQKECAGLRGELEAANQHVKIMQQRNEAVWDSYKDLRSTVNAEKTATTAKFGGASSITTNEPVETNVPTVESFCGHCGDCTNPTDSRIDDLLFELSVTANSYGGHYGLPMLYSLGRREMIKIVRSWLAKGKDNHTDPFISELAADLGVSEMDLIQYAAESTGGK